MSVPSPAADPHDGARTVLYVDDEPSNLELFRLQVGKAFHVCTAKSGNEALELLARQNIWVLLTDERMPGMSGVELLARTLDRWPDVVRIIVSAYSDAARLLAAINRGHAHEYLVKPWDRKELQTCIERAIVIAGRRRELSARADLCELHERDLAHSWREGLLVAQSASFRATLELARKAARSDAGVLITGETGTGKELVARLIHEESGRHRGPFVRVNCAALAEGVLESELFGHEQGAFTGANKTRRGRFELAQDGTLFLDEVGDVSAKMQGSLLRVLQEKELERVGGSTTIRVNARIIGATHRNLARLVREGRFREDLYYRLNVVPITVPPLRERHEDLAPLVHHFVMKHFGSASVSIADGVVEQLGRYGWPGNARELENMVQRALVLSSGSELTLDDFRFNLAFESEPPLPETTAIEEHPSGEEVEGGPSLREKARHAAREDLRKLLMLHGGNIARAARTLGVARTTLVSRAKRHGLIV